VNSEESLFAVGRRDQNIAEVLAKWGGLKGGIRVGMGKSSLYVIELRKKNPREKRPLLNCCLPLRMSADNLTGGYRE